MLRLVGLVYHSRVIQISVLYIFAATTCDGLRYPVQRYSFKI